MIAATMPSTAGQLTAVDLFAGAGGFTEGARNADINVIWCGNHNPQAVQFHARNHPNSIHVCQDLHQANWTEVPRHDVLLASPCCQGHSRARGRDRPHHDSQRSTAWAVVSCAEYHREELVVAENVLEFLDWTLYPAWEDAMRRLGYSVSPHVVDSADHGVPQHRVRLFLVCTRSRSPIQLKLPRRDHVGVGSVIQWDEHPWTPIQTPRRSPATLRRIAAGRARYGRRFVAPYYGSGSGETGRSLDRPIGTLTTVDRWAVIDGERMRMLQIPEAKAIMGLRQDYQLPTTKRDAMRMLGNMVSPVVATDMLQAARAQV
ncbi:DNA cytosine methyltransferase [Cupriavidus sp. CP313]